MTGPNARQADLEAALASVYRLLEPVLRRQLGELGLVGLEHKDGDPVVLARVFSPDHPLRAELDQALSQALAPFGVPHLLVELDAPSQAELAARLRQLGTGLGGGDPRVIGVASGKGGVGKSSVAVNLAVGLADIGLRVGVLDADIYGFSVAQMLSLPMEPLTCGDLLVAIPRWGVVVASMGVLVPDGEAVIWRGPMLHQALSHFISDTWWGPLDFLIVDMPPGTGDVAMSLASFFPRMEVLVVTTPQLAAQRVAQRAGIAARKLGLEVLGVVENMSWLEVEGQRLEVFGGGGGANLAAALGVELLVQVPLDPSAAESADSGIPLLRAAPETAPAQAFMQLAGRVVASGPRRRRPPGLRIAGSS